jgi:methionine-S-sulfoxide reductase
MRTLTALAGIFILGGLVAMTATLSATTARATQDSATARAIFAGGCFWCMEKPFEALDGVVAVTSGYVGGSKENPTYEEVSSGTTGHAEAVLVEYDPARIGYDQLLDVFWKNVDPTDAGGQFCDRGNQYRTGIFATTDEQEAQARASRQALDASGILPMRVVTEITRAGTFWPAEDYHQDYYKRNPIRYKFYRYNCGRDKVLDGLWGADGEE